MLARRGVNPRLVGLEGCVVGARHMAPSAARLSIAAANRSFATSSSLAAASARQRCRLPPSSMIARGGVFSFASSSSAPSSSSAMAALSMLPGWHERRRRYATETTNDEGVRAAAEAVTQTSEAVEKGGDAMASFVAAADPVTALEVVDVAGRTASAFPPINWLVDAMTFVHYSVPLSWAATAVCFTVAFRTLILPAVALTMQNSAKMRAVQPELEKIKGKYGPQVGTDVNVAMKYREEVRQVMAQHDVSMWKTMVPFFVQTPLFVSFFFTTRKLAEEEPGLQDSSFLFFHDLSAMDPYYIMPILTSLTMLATIELGSDGVGGQSNPMLKNFLRLFSVLAIPATSSLPIFTHIYWFTSNLFSLGQLGLFKVPFIKNALGLPDYKGVSPMVGTSTPEPAKPEAIYQRKPRIIRTKGSQ